MVAQLPYATVHYKYSLLAQKIKHLFRNTKKMCLTSRAVQFTESLAFTKCRSDAVK